MAEEAKVNVDENELYYVCAGNGIFGLKIFGEAPSLDACLVVVTEAAKSVFDNPTLRNSQKLYYLRSFRARRQNSIADIHIPGTEDVVQTYIDQLINPDKTTQAAEPTTEPTETTTTTTKKKKSTKE